MYLQLPWKSFNAFLYILISRFPNNDFKRLKSENKVVIKRRRIPATHGELPRRVFVTDTNTKLHNNQLLEADRSINVLNSKTVHKISSPPDSSKFNWMWPPNSMNFHNFNFEAFDAQFQRKPNKIPTFLRPGIPINRGGNQFSESASYSLSIILWCFHAHVWTHILFTEKKINITSHVSVLNYDTSYISLAVGLESRI